MPNYFWNWYENKKYDALLKKEDCFQNKAFLVGCCIEYLIEKGQKLNNLSDYRTLDEMLDYLIKGIIWTK